MLCRGGGKRLLGRVRVRERERDKPFQRGGRGSGHVREKEGELPIISSVNY